jgi:3-hydroxyanthranilate 3,4-dioxygenase
VPGNTPHNPVRFADTIGLVVERVRPPKSIGASPCSLLRTLPPTASVPPCSTTARSRPADRLRWYCKSGAHATPTTIREEAFHCEDLGTQLKPLIQAWMADPDLRRCKQCGTVAEAK